jgi:dTDP-4-dehydrorhamnose reductase
VSAAPRHTSARPLLLSRTGAQRRWPEHCILRSSIIYGPQCPTPVPRTLFLQFIDHALVEGATTTFFDDEFRCPVWVDDIKVCRSQWTCQFALHKACVQSGHWPTWAHGAAGVCRRSCACSFLANVSP